jgi:hypothetical protein
MMENILMQYFWGIFLSLLSASTAFSAEDLTKEKRAIGHFECIHIHGTGMLSLKQGKEDSLTIEAKTADLPQIMSEIKNDCLILGPQKTAKLNGPIHYLINIETLRHLETTGDINIVTQNTLKTPQLILSLAGDGKANIKLKNDESFTGKISGNGQITLQGSTQKQWLEINGNGVVNAQKFTTEKTTVAINGQGQATVRALQELDVNINGNGIVQYYGNPKIHQKISGSGEIIPLE